MDPHRFDSLSRLVAAGVPRRRLATGLLAGLVLPMFPRLTNRAAAACKKVGRSCERNSDCCAHAECPGNKCRCKRDFRECDRECVNSDTDKDHCGQCDNRCRAGERCCTGRCANLTTSDTNCGACGRDCDAAESCCDGECVDQTTDSDHCGGCGAACGARRECVGGVCVNPPGGCAPGADTCVDGETHPCGGSATCECHQTTEGATVCRDQTAPGSICGQCATSADCASFGPGAFCVVSDPVNDCCKSSPGKNFCGLPCPE